MRRPETILIHFRTEFPAPVTGGGFAVSLRLPETAGHNLFLVRWMMTVNLQGAPTQINGVAQMRSGPGPLFNNSVVPLYQSGAVLQEVNVLSISNFTPYVGRAKIDNASGGITIVTIPMTSVAAPETIFSYHTLEFEIE